MNKTYYYFIIIIITIINIPYTKQMYHAKEKKGPFDKMSLRSTLCA